MLPQMQTVFDADSADVDALIARVGDQTWGQLPPRENVDRNAAARNADPAGFEAPLKAYFQVLGRDGK